MSKWKTIPISTFLKERKDRFKPSEANELNQKRLYKIDFSGNIHILDDKTTNTNMILIKKGDLVISGINVEKGAVAVYEGKEDLLATIHYSSYEFDKSKIDIGYFKWFLKSKQFKDIVNSKIRGGIKTELKPKKFLPLEIPLPDLPTQIKIKDKINNVVNEITELKNLDESNEEFTDKLRQSILQEAVSGKLVPQNPNDEPASELLKKIQSEKEKIGKKKKIRKEKTLPPISKEEIPYELPKGWEWVRFLYLVDYNKKYPIKRGPFGSAIRKDFFVPKGPNTYKVYEQRNAIYNNPTLGDYYINENKFNELKAFEVEGGDLIISCSGTIGRIGFLPDKIEKGIINQALLKLSINEKIILKKYFEILFYTYIMETEHLKDVKGTAIKNIPPLTKLKKMLVPVPPLKEQKRIVAKVDQLMKLCDELQEQVKENQKSSELLMDAVLREAFEAN